MAIAYHRSWQAVFEDYWYQTLLAFITLEDIERIQAIEAEDADLHRALQLSYAYHEPKELVRQREAFRRKVDAPREPTPSTEELRQAMQDIGQRLHRIIPSE